jgi:acetyltransferase-like isoleucine patch superfamily enzyme
MSDSLSKSVANNFKNISGDGLLYFTNRIIANIPFHSIRAFFYRYFLKIIMEEGSHIFMEAWFDTRKKFTLGKNSVINEKCRLDNRGGIYIGMNVSISSQVCILTGDHDIQSPDFAGRARAVNIEDRVFIGTRAMILPGVTLGEGCVVGAGSVVTKDVAPFTIVAGIPAKPIGHRNENLTYTTNYPRLFF